MWPAAENAPSRPRFRASSLARRRASNASAAASMDASRASPASSFSLSPGGARYMKSMDPSRVSAAPWSAPKASSSRSRWSSSARSFVRRSSSAAFCSATQTAFWFA